MEMIKISTCLINENKMIINEILKKLHNSDFQISLLCRDEMRCRWLWVASMLKKMNFFLSSWVFNQSVFFVSFVNLFMRAARIQFSAQFRGLKTNISVFRESLFCWLERTRLFLSCRIFYIRWRFFFVFGPNIKTLQISDTFVIVKTPFLAFSYRVGIFISNCIIVCCWIFVRRIWFFGIILVFLVWWVCW